MDETMSLRFSVRETNILSGGWSAVLLDNLAVTPVPEPNGAIHILLSGLTFVLRRARKSDNIR
jgi:hypothetical protein